MPSFRLALLLLVLTSALGVPPQYFYSKATATVAEDAGGCILSSWKGTDADGMAGYPWITTVDCPAGGNASYTAEGTLATGHAQAFLARGSIAYANATADGGSGGSGSGGGYGKEEVIDVMGSALWMNVGARVRVRVEGFVYIVGAAWALSPDAAQPPTFFGSSYAAPAVRAYRARDAAPNADPPASSTAAAANHHDPHINNGTTNARDLTWNSLTLVDPPSIAVMNCAPQASYVWFHFHPAGSVYMPYAGRICFLTDEKLCVEPGEARWTSPNLYYYETFEKIEAPNAEADALVKLAFPADNATACVHPVVFGVTNFDPKVSAGQPNFVDIPENAVVGKKWGTFKQMTVRSTTVVSKAVTLDDEL